MLVCRLIGRKITYVHRRLWPAVVRLGKRFSPSDLARIDEVHTASGKHVVHTIRFPDWVPEEVTAQARTLDEAGALVQLEPWGDKLIAIRKTADSNRPR